MKRLIFVLLILGTLPLVNAVPINITSMTPANNSNFQIINGVFATIPFSVSCTNGTSANCSNATLHIYDNADNKLVIRDIHFLDNILVINGTGKGDTTNIDDGNYYTVHEVAGGTVDCLTMIINFSNLPTHLEHTIFLNHRYTGGAGHVIHLWWYNFTSDTWVNFLNQIKTTTDVSYRSNLLPDIDAINAEGNISIKINHSEGSNCIGSHDYLLDLILLEDYSDTHNFSNGIDLEIIELNESGSSYKYIFTANDTSNNEVAFSEGNYTITVSFAQNIVITMSDLNLNSYDIPILNKLFTGKNQLLIYENDTYMNTITTNSQIILNSIYNYSFIFKPSKSGTLSNWSAFLNLISTYYLVIISIIIIIVAIKFLRR